jgi:hypothetical protein
MGFLTQLDNWLSSRPVKKSEDQPVYQVVQYGSTKSYTFRRDVLKDNFRIPEFGDQPILISVLRATQSFYLPDVTDEDFDNLRQMLIQLDDVILGGLKDPNNWVLPKGFSDYPFVKQRLDRNYPIAQIINTILQATRLYIWLFKKDDETVSELIPHLLELEEVFEPLRLRDPSEEATQMMR